jgi:Protein of unknown function (DUF1588)
VFTPPKLTGTTRRERVNSVTGEGTCGASCHARLINPAGYPLEFFDDTGKYRTQDNGQPVDGTATYPFRAGAENYDGPIEWSRAVTDSAEAHDRADSSRRSGAFSKNRNDDDFRQLTRPSTDIHSECVQRTAARPESGSSVVVWKRVNRDPVEAPLRRDQVRASRAPTHNLESCTTSPLLHSRQTYRQRDPQVWAGAQMVSPPAAAKPCLCDRRRKNSHSARGARDATQHRTPNRPL